MNTNLFYDVYKKYTDMPPDTRLMTYQQLVVNYFIDSQVKGLVIYHQTGVGKTRVAVAVAERLKSDHLIVVIEDKILHANMVTNITEYGADVSGYMFITRNSANLTTTWQRLEARGKKILFIFDEVHNFVNSISRGSKSAVFIYDQIRKLKCRVLCLSGTPAINTPHEFAILFNLVSDFGRYTMFPEDQQEFYRYFVDARENKITNKTKFQARIAGYVSYYGDNYFRDSAETDIVKAGFPTEHPLNVVRVKMSDIQYIQYAAAREQEVLEDSRRFSKPVQPGRFASQTASGTYRIRTRQLSNYAPADSWEKASPKYCSIRRQVTADAKVSKKSVVYSSFIDVGLMEIARSLADIGWVELGQHKGPGAFVYAIVSGKVIDETRAAIISAYNAPENAHGANIMAVLVSSVAAQGIELKNTRAIHIVEFGWNYSLFEQIVARCVRYNSHADLPKDEQDVQPYVYIAELPEAEQKDDSPETTDEYMYARAVNNMKLIVSFRLAIAEASVDCMTFNKSTLLNCMFCRPTGERLYEYNIIDDMQYGCPCRQIVPRKVSVKLVDVDGVQYHENTETGELYAIENTIGPVVN